MKSFDSVTDIITNEFITSPVGTMTGIFSLIGGIYAAFLLLRKFLTAPIKGKSEFLSQAGIPAWPLRLFYVSLPLKTIPKNTRTDLFFGLLLILVGAGSAFYLSIMHMKTLLTPQNGTLLVYKPNNEFFYLTHDSAKSAALFPGHTLAVTTEQCGKMPVNKLARRSRLSADLTGFICDMFSKKEYTQYISQEIASFDKSKTVLYIALSTFETGLFWLAISAILTLYYRKIVSTHIIEQHKKAESYLT